MTQKDFIVLSIYEFHMSSCALMINGEVAAAAHEERFSRIKLDAGFPYKAASFCLREAGVKPEEVDVVALVNERFHHNAIATILFKRFTLYSIQDWIDENERYWKPRLLEKKEMGSFFHLMGGADRVQEHYYDLKDLDMNAGAEEVNRVFNRIRKETVERLLGVPQERVVLLPHYMCHHYHAYYSGNLRGSDVVVAHLEGDGEQYNSAVSIPTDQGLKLLRGSNQSDLGRLYQWITLLLGMKPYHHEYKVMGLAPYATDSEITKSLKIFEPIFKLDEKNLTVVYNKKPDDLYFYFRDRFEGHRFDGIAGALQTLVERYLTEWIEIVVNKTGRSRVCYGGGVAMNVKANMLISRLECVEDLFVPLSPGDETNVFGAGYWMTEKHFLETGLNPEDIPPMKTHYLGPQFTRSDVLKSVEEMMIKEKGFAVTENVNNAEAAKLLAEGMIIARFQGKSEFGQRGLGNRSILGDPSNPGIVNKINHQIKYRDFWMPFAPTILEEDQGKCLDNPKNISADYMTVCFPVKEDYVDKLKGAIHEGDITARPQILRRDANPEYHDFISEFKKIKGIGAILNTSFNLHGEPIVGNPKDALHTFINSKLDALWMHDILVSRKP